MPHPLATAVPGIDFPLKGLFGFVTAPPFFKFFTLAALVFETTVLPLEPSFFFFLAVEALCDLLKDRALDAGKHLSGFFLSLEVPHSPFIDPSAPILTHFWSSHFCNSPIIFSFFLSLLHNLGLYNILKQLNLHTLMGRYQKYV